MSLRHLLLFLPLIVSCRQSIMEKKNDMHPTDSHSFAKPSEVSVKHLDLNLHVDFNNKVLSGTATLTLENKAKTNKLYLDTRDLNIKKITLDNDTAAVRFVLKDAVEFLGNELVVDITPSTAKITIEYETSPGAAALQWLSPEQTAGKKLPFLFTQSQAILARSWIPLQDSPGVRFTYSATIKVPAEVMAVMSAENDTVLHADGIYRFNMPQPIPSYLMALAVGDLRHRSYDYRSGVFAEPVMIEKVAYEFADMPRMISSAEELYGPYQWGRYDVIVLPPSFPFGGMENPRITFATPTVVAGDRSLTALIAHELAHSWSGNLVTNATWNDFWLNEGFTVYFENRIMEKIYGKPYSDMLMKLGFDELKNTLAEKGDTSADTHLYLDLKGRDPDEGVSDIAYEKGRMFLYTVETNVGRERWDAFLKKYFTENAFKSMDTKTFLEYFDKELIKGDETLKKKINADAWVYGPGLPANCPEVLSEELTRAEKAAADFKNGKSPSLLDTAKWTTHHWLHFLRSLGNKLSPGAMKQLDNSFHFTASGNAEIKCAWLLLSIKSDYKEAYPSLEKFLADVGRRKFVKPLYAELGKTEEGLNFARNVYEKTRSGYHSVTYNTIDEILRWNEQEKVMEQR